MNSSPEKQRRPASARLTPKNSHPAALDPTDALSHGFDVKPAAALTLLLTTGWLNAAIPTLHFTTVPEAKTILTTEDGFTNHLSPFDRAARLASAEPVSTKQYLDFVAAEARPWNDEEKRLLNTAYDSIKDSLTTYNLPLRCG